VAQELKSKHLFYKSVNSLLIIGQEIDAGKHSHHALQVSISLDIPFLFECASISDHFEGVIIGPDIDHSLSGISGRQALLLLDPEHHQSKEIIEQLLDNNGIYILQGELLDKLRSYINAHLSEQSPTNLSIDNLLNILVSQPQPLPKMDTRIQAVINYIAQQPQKIANIQELAQHSNLSESRLSHLFKQHVGIPIRRYLLWQRLLDASIFAATGNSLTEAAHQAGFTDSSHFTRTFKSMFGIHPSSFIKNIEFVKTNQE